MVMSLNVSLALDERLGLQLVSVARAEIEGIRQAGGNAKLFQYEFFDHAK